MNINDEDDLFDNGKEEEIPLSDTPREDAPLADRMRPRDFPDFVGQTEIIGQGAPLRILIETDQLRSLVFWGPPGTGKTTLAMIIARKTKSAFISLSAVTSGIKDVKTVMEQARKNRRLYHKRTILFIDEIHRFNKAQQDAFLPYVEDGSVILIGATTENPSFSVVSALMSRCRVFVLRGLESDEIVALLTKALADKDRGLGNRSYRIDDDVLVRISQLVDGDARRALNLLELTSQLSYKSGDTHVIDATVLSSVLQRQQLIYDKTGEEHYNIISALHKSIRSSDVQAALYCSSRMLQAGDDPLYVARR
ncbi:MAG: AAA family ATPase, partial [Candidatus Sumerlaeales bacterium]|nr:AAA family ATPase [Candidatus Sumerlaeales bacterium]